ncbi:MAG: aspartate--ammonia ligase [Tissierellales bacterium]|jgi:aspartate--ammonia ligase|nr:aspartate--ammonia ligase [Tissierellales bacterium]
MEKLIMPKDYKGSLSLRETELAIKKTKDFFQKELSKTLNLTRVSAPLFVRPETGLNDNLNGTESAVSFNVKDADSCHAEIVHSLAKWKRMALHRYDFGLYEGLYTDMNAIRCEEDLDNIHSIYVDQWDWEKIIPMVDRTEEKLKETVRKIYSVFKRTELYLSLEYSTLHPILPEDISFVTTYELESRFPDLTPKEREYEIAKEKGAVFIMKIGGKLASGEKHDGRSPDYDDWTLNGDIIFYYPVLDIALELSSMGIRVDAEALTKQLEIEGCSERASLPFHSKLLAGQLPQTMGGGIGQSRICMFFLRKAHIGEVQASIWPEDMQSICKEKGIRLL